MHQSLTHLPAYKPPSIYEVPKRRPAGWIQPLEPNRPEPELLLRKVFQYQLQLFSFQSFNKRELKI
jgi:hypothetical protein